MKHFLYKSYKSIYLIATIGLFLICKKSNGQTYSLNFNSDKYVTKKVTVGNQSINVRAYEHIIYVGKPIDSTYEQMNIFIPEAYFNGESRYGFNAINAPIFLPNEIGGYMPATPGTIENKGLGGFPGGGMPPMDGKQKKMPPMPMQENKESKPSTIAEALLQGYVVASPGARGRTTKNEQGIYTGKAPAAIVDLKAAVRYLKLNDQIMPGDANKIISNGTSAGGAMSALLGATGDAPEYLPYLKAIGAAETSDAIFATSAYCPITNLDHADMAYEWQFNGIKSYYSRGFGRSSSTSGTALTKDQIKVANELKAQFPNYVNSLGLKDEKGSAISLDKNGNGSFKDYLKSFVIQSAQIAKDTGRDLSTLSWLTIKDGKVVDLNWNEYIEYMQRMKTPPAFDALDLSSGENQEFGTESIDKQHFTNYSQTNSYIKSATIADSNIIKLMNPMDFIGKSDVKTTKYWRIRHGSKDKDTGLAISLILATKLKNEGNMVDYALPWDRPHSGDYDLDELFKWINTIVK